MRRLIIALCVGLLLWPHTACAGEGAVLIYDREIQDYLESLEKPIWKAAGLDPNNLHIYVIRDSSVNAFVLTGQNIFIFTGLLTYVQSSQELVGILAHETGHIAAGHVILGTQAQRQSLYMQLAALTLGVAAIAVGAGGAAGMAIMAAGMSAGLDHVLAHSRAQEAAADQAAVSFLDKAHMSSAGMLTVFERFSKEESRLKGVDPFLLTHPLSSQRLAMLTTRVCHSPYYATPLPPARDEALRMIQAKLHAFIDTPSQVERRYDHATSPQALYARAILAQRMGRKEEALSLIDSLLAQKQGSQSAYIFELRGQFLMEYGQYAKALQAFEQASTHYDGNASEFLLQQAQALSQMGCFKKALQRLQRAQGLNQDNPLIYYEMSICYGHLNDIGMAELSLAQRDLLIGDLKDAQMHARNAQKSLPRGSPGWVQSEDILLQKP